MSDNQEKLELEEQPQAEDVEGYKFQPIKGFPMLNWRGKRPFTSTQFYPAQLKETYGEEVDGWRNKIYWGDNLQVMSHLLKEFRGKVDLIYIDPPFDSKADYKKKIKLRGKEVKSDTGGFEEKQYTDIWNNDEYLQFMYERLVVIRELLSTQGTLYLHCDQRVSSYLRLICDEIFGTKNFRSWICWKSSPGHSDQSFFNDMQNHILMYTKTDNAIWNQLYAAYDKNYLSSHYQKKEKDGRLFEDDNLTAYGLSGGGYEYEWNGHTKLWRRPIESMQALEDEGRIYYTKNGVARYKRYLDEMPGVPLSDLWVDIPRLNSQALEKENYPTQKPEALLERIMAASSVENSLVFDCFMGSGTTQAAALKMGRRFIGADINLGAIQTTTRRLINASEKSSEIRQGFEVYNVNNYDIFRNPAQARDLLLDALEVQKLEMSSVFDGEKDGRMVKIMPVNRIATKADLGELISGFDYKAFEKRQNENPNQPVEKVLLVCMGHEPDLKAELELEVKPFRIDVEVIDILRDKSQLEFKRDSEAELAINDGHLEIKLFYPMSLLQKLSLQKEQVTDWREMVESIMVDWNYDGAILQPTVLDVPSKDEFVSGKYEIPEDASTIRVKITDLLSESWEGNIDG